MPPMLQIAKLKPFDTELFLRSASEGTASATYRAGNHFSQGDVSTASQSSGRRRQAFGVVSQRQRSRRVVEAGAFFGEGAVAGVPFATKWPPR